MAIVLRSMRYAIFLLSSTPSCLLSLSLTLMRWGFMNSVLTEPRISFCPYSTSDSFPALNIMHTYTAYSWSAITDGNLKLAQVTSVKIFLAIKVLKYLHSHCQSRTFHSHWIHAMVLHSAWWYSNHLHTNTSFQLSRGNHHKNKTLSKIV